MKKLMVVTPEQASKVMDIYNHCDRFYQEHVIQNILRALNIDFYYDIYTQKIVLEVKEDAE